MTVPLRSVGSRKEWGCSNAVPIIVARSGAERGTGKE